MGVQREISRGLALRALRRSLVKYRSAKRCRAVTVKTIRDLTTDVERSAALLELKADCRLCRQCDLGRV